MTQSMGMENIEKRARTVTMQRYIWGEEGGPCYFLQMYGWERLTTRQHKRRNAINASTFEAINNSLIFVRVFDGRVCLSIEVKKASILNIAINCQTILSFDLMFKMFKCIFCCRDRCLPWVFGCSESNLSFHYRSVGDRFILKTTSSDRLV